MPVVPCPLCGYDAPGTSCPHCGGAPAERSLAAPPRGALGAVLDGLFALPFGVWFLVRTRGTKRWLVPPLVLTVLLFAVSAWASWALVTRAFEAAVPNDVDLGPMRWAWLEGLSESWNWLKATWHWIAGALQWLVDFVLAWLPGVLSKSIVWLLVTWLIGWYLFSMAYEAVAGPFLDEIQGRLEARWFGDDPRKRLQRPTDVPAEHCAKRSVQWGAVAVLAIALSLFVPGASLWMGLLAVPVIAGLAVRLDAEYGRWLGWVASIEGRALWVGIKASMVTGVLLVLALPLLLVPLIGPVLFACVAGFATSVSLLDIAFERRAWELSDRLRFVGHNLVPLVVFGAVSGALLAVPVLGWLVVVPGASIGGLWLLCRLDKDRLRPEGRRWGRGGG